MFAERAPAPRRPPAGIRGIVGEDQPRRGDLEFERIDAGIAKAEIGVPAERHRRVLAADVGHAFQERDRPLADRLTFSRSEMAKG